MEPQTPAPYSITLRSLLRWCMPRPVASRAVFSSLCALVLTAVSVLVIVWTFARSFIYAPLILISVFWLVVVVGSYISSMDSPTVHTRRMLVSDFPVSLTGGCVLLFVWSRWLVLPALLVAFAAALLYSPVFALVEVMALLVAASASRMLRA